MKHFLGCIPDVKDKRDFLFRSPVAAAELPQAVDLRPQQSPVRDQGNEGSCVGFGTVVGMREWMALVAKRNVPLSPAMQYWEARNYEGTTNQDSGAMIRDGLRALKNIGVCPECDDLYVAGQFTAAPSAKAVYDAAAFKIVSYHRVYKVTGMQQALAAGNPVVIGIQVYSSFEDDWTASTGFVPIPKRGEEFLGGHCMFVVGYQTGKDWKGGGYFTAKNSWGTDWGDKGYCHIPFAYFTTRHAPDMWVAV